MPRPVWNGNISFGLVNIPVKLYNTTKQISVRFHQLRKSDGCRIEYKKVCGSDGQEVSDENITRGVELSPDHYIVITPHELGALFPHATRSIEIEDFINPEQIDPVYYEQSFYLVPDKGAEKSYTLLLKAMQNTKRAGLAQFVFRAKAYLAVVRPIGKTLGLSIMVFPDEIVNVADSESLPDAEAMPPTKELELAEELIDTLTASFDPQKYSDTYRLRVKKLIDTKADGQDIITPPAAADKPKAKVIDIMAALEASLAATKKKNQLGRGGKKPASKLRPGT